MALEADFIACFTDVVSVRTRTGQDSFGNDTHSTATNVNVFIDSDEVSLGSPDSQEQQSGLNSRTLSIIMAVDAISERDLITYDSVTFSVTSVTVYRDEDGPHHQVVSATSDIKE